MAKISKDAENGIAINDNLCVKIQKNDEKCRKICTIQKKAVILHRILKVTGIIGEYGN